MAGGGIFNAQLKTKDDVRLMGINYLGSSYITNLIWLWVDASAYTGSVLSQLYFGTTGWSPMVPRYNFTGTLDTRDGRKMMLFKHDANATAPPQNVGASANRWNGVNWLSTPLPWTP